MIKHIIFDFDGTIADSSEIGIKIYNELSEKYHYKKLSIEELRVLNNKPIKERLKHIGLKFYKVPNLVIDALSCYRELIMELKIFEEIKKPVIALKKEGYHLTIISSNSEDNIKSFLKRYELEYFENIISARNIFGKDKAVKSYLKRFSLKPDEIIYIGDELRDIEACKKVGVKIISVTWGFDSVSLLKSGNPDYIIFNPGEIPDMIRSLRD